MHCPVVSERQAGEGQGLMAVLPPAPGPRRYKRHRGGTGRAAGVGGCVGRGVERVWLRSQAEPGAGIGTAAGALIALPTGHVGGFSVGVLLARECVSRVMAAWQAAAAVQGRRKGPGAQREVHHAGTAVAVVGYRSSVDVEALVSRCCCLVLLVRDARVNELGWRRSGCVRCEFESGSGWGPCQPFNGRGLARGDSISSARSTLKTPHTCFALPRMRCAL